MRFEPKIIRDETEWNDALPLDLPDDLAALGEQLRDDALRLGECYPPRAAQRLDEVVAGPIFRKRRFRWWPAAAALFLAAATGFSAWSFLRTPAPETDLAAERAAAAAPPDAAEPVAASRSADEPSPAVAADESPYAAPAVPVGLLIPQLSGPELEAMIDLMEQQPGDEVRVAL